MSCWRSWSLTCFATIFLLLSSRSSSVSVSVQSSPALTSMSSNGNTNANPNILVTGGAGYIGSHTIVCLLEAGYDITVVDNLVNSNEESLRRVLEISGCDSKRLRFFNVDLCDKDALEGVFKSSPKLSACIHFAGLKAVGESVQKPLLYYQNNLGSTINLLELMDKYGCKSIVFSSSATVYGSAEVPITESTPTGTGITNAYGRTKFMIEEILKDFKKSKDLQPIAGEDPWSVVTLRYFNPVGSHPSGKIGEDPNGIPNNLMPYVAQVAVGRRPLVTVFGDDYDTPDGTGVRDYIHVMDLAMGHVAALRFMSPPPSSHSASPIFTPSEAVSKGLGHYSVFNLGTGRGNSVLEMIAAMSKACGRQLPYQIAARREGDIAVCYADTKKAETELGWRAMLSLDQMCADLWKWQSSNPNGYATGDK